MAGGGVWWRAGSNEEMVSKVEEERVEPLEIFVSEDPHCSQNLTTNDITYGGHQCSILTLAWGGQNFSDHTLAFDLFNTVLEAMFDSGQRGRVDLDERIANHNGRLVF
ncbi:hypothetical protein FRC06_003312, partial [Ceratobasidium sp. 370]